MDYLILLKIFSGLLFLLIIPGYFSLIFLQKNDYSIGLYEGVVYSFIVSIFIWMLISFFSYKYEANSYIPIILSSSLAVINIILIVLNKNIRLKFQNRPNEYWFLPVSIFFAMLIGYSTQYQTSNSDAFAHLANIRNIYSSNFIQNCDGLLGPGNSSINAYGCHPWYLTIGMVYKFTNIDPALGHTAMTSFMCLLFILSSFVFFKAISNNEIISKILAIIFFAINILNSIYTWGPSNYFFDPIGNLLFPFHLASIIILILLTSLIKCLFNENKYYIYIFSISVYVITRLHPIAIIWIPISIASIIFVKMFFYDNVKIIKFNLLFVLLPILIIFINIYDILSCNNTHEYDMNIISPLDQWRNSGGNLLQLSENLYISDPLIYLRSRGAYDILTIFAYTILIKCNRFKMYLSKNNLGISINNCAALYIGILLSIYFVIFNPLATAFLIHYTQSSTTLYRAFLFFHAPLTSITLYFLFVFTGAFFPRLICIKIISIVSSLLISTLLFINLDYLKKIYTNFGNYFSTSSSVYKEPFNTLRGLESGKVAVNPAISTAVAALTHMDPIITEAWRAKTLLDHQTDKSANSMIISFGSDCDNLYSLIRKYDIRWIVSDINSNAEENQRKICSSIIYKKVAGNYLIWEYLPGRDRLQ